MNNKSNMFKGLSATDIHPTFRADLSVLAAIPPDKASFLAEIIVADANELSPTPLSSLVKVVSNRLGVSSEKARPFARATRSLASRLANADDDPALIVDDLLSMQLITPQTKDILTELLNVLRKHRAELTGRENRQKNALGGGFHLANWSVFTDYRIAYEKYDISDIDLDSYQPTITGLIPVVTLQLDIHSTAEEKSIAIRLPESDLVRLERAIRVARLQLTAMQKYSQGGK